MDDVKTGKVCWFDPRAGYGFISQDNRERDLFVHFSDIVMAEEGAFRTLKKGQDIVYRIGKNNKGQDKAIDVQDKADYEKSQA